LDIQLYYLLLFAPLPSVRDIVLLSSFAFIMWVFVHKGQELMIFFLFPPSIAHENLFSCATIKQTRVSSPFRSDPNLFRQRFAVDRRDAILL
jgi:hypothetical protein